MSLIIVRQGVQCGAMKNETHGVMDFLQSIRVVGKMIREFKLKLVGDSIPEFWREATRECVTLLGWRYAVLRDQECRNRHKFPMIPS